MRTQSARVAQGLPTLHTSKQAAVGRHAVQPQQRQHAAAAAGPSSRHAVSRAERMLKGLSVRAVATPDLDVALATAPRGAQWAVRVATCSGAAWLLCSDALLGGSDINLTAAGNLLSWVGAAMFRMRSFLRATAAAHRQPPPTHLPSLASGPPLPPQVHKFGGTCVSAAERIASVAEYIVKNAESSHNVVVVSAMGSHPSSPVKASARRAPLPLPGAAPLQGVQPLQPCALQLPLLALPGACSHSSGGVTLLAQPAARRAHRS